MWKINTTLNSLLAIMKPYQHGIISMILEARKGLGTSQIHNALLEKGFIISRASVINYCKLLAENDVIAFEEENGKGGSRRIYSKSMSWESILEFIHLQVLGKMTGAFPDSKYLKETAGLLSK